MLASSMTQKNAAEHGFHRPVQSQLQRRLSEIGYRWATDTKFGPLRKCKLRRKQRLPDNPSAHSAAN